VTREPPQDGPQHGLGRLAPAGALHQIREAEEEVGVLVVGRAGRDPVAQEVQLPSVAGAATTEHANDGAGGERVLGIAHGDPRQTVQRAGQVPRLDQARPRLVV
jgi:hypothetical protein